MFSVLLPIVTIGSHTQVAMELDPSSALREALINLLVAIETVDRSTGIRSREAYSNLLIAASHAKKVLAECPLPLHQEPVAKF
jgi:hypothetical protein